MPSWEEYGTRVDVRLRTKAMPMESFDITGKRQLFIDNVPVAREESLRRTLHQPTRLEGNPVIAPTSPAEGQIAWVSVIRDQEDSRFKAWYHTGNGLGYAVSEDGLHWEKPAIRTAAEVAAGSAPNLVLAVRGMDSPSVIKDPLEADPARRYKLFMKWGGPPYGMWTAFSADGVRWKIAERAALTSENDPGINDRPTMMQDVGKKRYLAFTKREILNPYGQGDWGSIHRARCVSVSDDFERWSDPILVLKPDDQDPPDLQIYGHQGFVYQSLYLGLMDIFHSRDTGPDERTIDVQLAVSRDGLTWWRAGNRQTFLPRGGADAWDRFIVAPANSPPIEMGDEIWFYYRGRGHGRHGGVAEHRRGQPWGVPGHEEDPPLPPGVPPNGTGLARLRKDGFVSLDAAGPPGELLTRPLLFSGGACGSALRINAEARGGRIAAEVCRAHRVDWRYPGQAWTVGEPIGGFCLADCRSFRGDSVDALLRWKERESLEGLAGEPLVIRFVLENASLYSFQIG